MAEFTEFIAAVRQGEPRRHVNDFLFFTRPFVFKHDESLFNDFRYEITAALGVPGRALALVGSAQLGFSLNPDHYGRKFREKSDVDVVIVSAPRFDEAWLELAELDKETWLKDGPTAARMKRCREDLFWGFIRLEELPRVLSLARQWLPTLSRFSTDIRFGPRDIRGRLYRSWEQAERSYAAQIEMLRLSAAAMAGQRETEAL